MDAVDKIIEILKQHEAEVDNWNSAFFENNYDKVAKEISVLFDSIMDNLTEDSLTGSSEGKF